MKTANETSTADSGRASKSEPANTSGSKPAPEPGKPAPTSNEAAFLAQQVADAKAAVAHTLSMIGKDFGQSVNIAGWTRQYPWMTLAASTVAGFVAVAALVPSKQEQALRKLEKIERALNPEPVTQPPPAVNGDGDSSRQYKSGQTSFMRSILGEVVKAVQPALLSMLTAGVTAKATRPSQEEMQAAAAAEYHGIPPQDAQNA